MAARVGNKSCLEHLFKKERVGEILSKKNKDGQTLLHLSLLSGRVECVKYLVKKSPKGIFLEQNTQKGCYLQLF
ncbi:ankyrin repeat family protein [Wolbachia endosymbiont of Trichogramma pretiosum]|nr:ankyrin repeat family protein [Wolbachia endosymbiont of Trichogramma pretiosum]